MALALTSCSKKCIPTVKYIDRITYVNTPIRCTVPDTNCSILNGSIGNKLIQSLECIANLRKNQEACQ